jgi:Concanavalin A-like lectin/glucanases superfamily
MARQFVDGSYGFIGGAPPSTLPVTLAAWFRPTDFSTYPVLISLEDTGGASHSVHLRAEAGSGGSSAAVVVSGVGSGVSTAGTGVLGAWAHYGAVFASTTSRTGYLNGVPGTPNIASWDTALGLSKVGFLWSGYQMATGDIAEAAIWSAALTPDELAALAKGISPILIRPSALHAYWPLAGNLLPEPDLWRNNLALAINGSHPKAAHPRVFNPWQTTVDEAPIASIRFQAAPAFSIASAGALTAPIRFAAAASLALAVTSAILTAPPAPMQAAAGVTVGTSAFLSSTARLSGAAGIRLATTASFVPPTMLGAAGITIGTRATITPGPRETQVGIAIGGVDVKGRVRRDGLTIHDVLNDAPNTCSLVMDGDGPAVGQSLRITLNEGSRVLFAGQVQSVDQAFESLPTNVAWAVQAIDDTAAANYRRPFGTFVDTSASAIAVAMTLKYAPAFSTAGIASGLPPVSIVFDGADTFIGCLARLANAIGGYCKVEDKRVYLFLVDTAAAPDPIDLVHRFLHTPAIQANVDSSQLRTRVYGKGYGENIQADLAAGEALVPIQDGVTFPAFGGEAIAATTPDGAQSERIAFTGVELQGGGTLVGPGAGPTIAPVLALAPGAGVTNGPHDVAVVFVTATGKSLPGPFASVDVPYFPPPTSAPVAGAATSGTGPDQGAHDYAASFVTSFGETTPSPVSNAIGTSAAAGQVGAPGACTSSPSLVPGNIASTVGASYQVTFVTSQGETEGGAVSAGHAPPGVPLGSAGTGIVNGSFGSAAGGSMTPGTWYRYFYSFLTASGYETALESVVDVFVNPGHGSVVLNYLVAHPDPRVTRRRLYRGTQVSGISPVGGRLVTEINHNSPVAYTDTASDASIAGNEQYFLTGQGSPSGPRGTAPGYQIAVASIPIGPAGVTSRKLYRKVNGTGIARLAGSIPNNTQTTFTDNVADASLVVDVPTSNGTGTAVQKIPVSNIPIGPPGTTARNLYRRFNGAGAFRLVTQIANNSATTYTDGVPNTGLGAAALSTPTAVGNQILAAIPVGASAVTQREIYMSPVGTNVRKLALVVPNNTATSATITASDATLGAAAGEPIADTSGLQQPNGQVNPGSTLLPVAAAATFLPGGGWVILSGGQVVRYHGISGQTLTGIPAAGSGSITTTVLYGSQAIPSPMLVGVTGLGVPVLKGASVNIWVQRDDLLAQAEQAARAGGDGIVEYLLVDTRRGLESLTARCDADLALFSRPIVTVSYATRDLKTQSGKQITVDLDSPRISETLTIQEVTITEIDIAPGLAPRFMVRASTVRFSLEDTLRRLVGGGSIVGGSS